MYIVTYKNDIRFPAIAVHLDNRVAWYKAVDLWFVWWYTVAVLVALKSRAHYNYWRGTLVGLYLRQSVNYRQVKYKHPVKNNYIWEIS